MNAIFCGGVERFLVQRCGVFHQKTNEAYM